MTSDDTVPFFTVLTATVRHDKSLSSDAKLLYSEIFTCQNQNGYCFFDISYVAELYGFQENTVEQCIKSLVDSGYIRLDDVSVDKKPNAKELKIFLLKG
jgi:hypothetical protein